MSYMVFTGVEHYRGSPADVNITPGGTASNPALLFSFNRTASEGEVFESLFSFSASNSLSGLTGVSFDLAPPTVAGDAAVTAILDVCPNGSFTAGDPLSCPASRASLVLFAIDGSTLLSNSVTVPVSNSLDVLLDFTLDGGTSGSASLGSARVEFSAAPEPSAVPEPSAGLLAALGLSAFGLSRARRRRLPGDTNAPSRGLGRRGCA